MDSIPLPLGRPAYSAIVPSVSHARRATTNLELNHPSFGPPARDILAPNTFGTITSTISAPRVVELALKFYF